MQRYDDRDFSRHRFEEDERTRSGRYADEERQGWGRGERSGDFGERRPESFGQRGAGEYGRREAEHGRFGSGWEGGSDRERGFGGQDGYGQQYGYGQPGGNGQQSGYGQPFRRLAENRMVHGPHTGRGPRGYRRSDERIREEICERLTQHGDIDASDLEIDVDDGEVTLGGMVDSRQTRRMAEEAIEDVSGVRDVTNQIRVRQGSGAEQRSYGSTGAGLGTSGAAASDRVQLRNGMEVEGSDGKKIGQVKEVRDNDFLLERSMQRDVYVPFAALMRVTADRVTLNVVGDRIDDLHWESPSAFGEPGWSRPATGSSKSGSGQQTSAETTGRERQPVAAGSVGQSTGTGYRYGQEMASDPRFHGRDWEAAEPDLRTGYADWARRRGMAGENDDAAWERLHEEVRRAWDESQR